MAPALFSPLTIRLAVPADRTALVRLAQLDSQAVPAGPHLVAERDGRIDVALSLSTGEQIADPFRRTAELCELLRRHAGGLRPAGPGAPLPRLQPRPAAVTP
jgi:hypothetical protein